jgi:hypothetical protein
MGDMGEVFRDMTAEKKQRKESSEPKRMQYAIEQITKLGYEIIEKDSTKIVFMFKDSPITFFPYTGWHTGKTIKDGRGINNLIEQLHD